MEQHALIALVVVLLGDLLAAMGVPLPQTNVPDLLDFDQLVARVYASGVALIPVGPDGRLHFLSHSIVLRVPFLNIYQHRRLASRARWGLPYNWSWHVFEEEKTFDAKKT